MRTVYAFQCEIAPKQGQTGEQCLEELIQTGSGWVQDAMKRSGVANAAALDWSGQQVEYAPRVHGQAQRQRTSEAEIAKATWSQPNIKDDSLGFAHEIVVTRLGERLHFSYVMRVYSRDSKLKPSSFVVRPPQLITKILSSFDCRVGNEKIRPNPRRLAAADIQAFVNDELISEHRTLPVIAVSPDKANEKPVIDVDKLAKLVIGLAHVVVLPDRWATFALTNELGKERSCFWGAVRVYWPGIERDFEVFKQPLYLPATIERKRAMNFPLEEELFRELRNTATFRMPEHPLAREAREVMDKAARQEVDALRAKVDDGKTKSKALQSYLDKADAELRSARERSSQLADENGRLEAQVEQLMGDNELLRRKADDQQGEIEALKKSFADIKDWKPDSPEAAQTPQEQQPAEYKSVFDAYTKAEAAFGAQLVFLDSARKSAEESPYRNADAVYGSFEAIALVADGWANGSLGKSIKDAFRDLGQPYAGAISQTTKNKYGSEYTFKYNGEKQLFDKHITLGAKDPESCLSIHMHFDESAKKVVIGWCGRHLSNTKS